MCGVLVHGKEAYKWGEGVVAEYIKSLLFIGKLAEDNQSHLRDEEWLV
jgi:hypothetical protein